VYEMGFNPIGFIGSALSGIFGGSKKKTDANAAELRDFQKRQEDNQRLFQERMLALQAAQKPTGMQISPIILIAGVAVVGMIFIPQMMKR